MRVALTREVSSAIASCELTHLDRQAIDVDKARDQHAQYEACLRKLDCRVERLPAASHLPDGVFVEDTALVLDELAVILRPGVESRRPETASVAEVLDRYRSLHFIEDPGTLDGGDILQLGKTLYVGHMKRSNVEGVEQLRSILKGFGYEVRGVDIEHCLHLKSALTRIGESQVLINPDWVDAGAFQGVDMVKVDPAEAMAANALLIGEELVFPKAYPQTGARLEKLGFKVNWVDASELAKAEGALTCCSLVFSG